MLADQSNLFWPNTPLDTSVGYRMSMQACNCA